MPTKSKDKDMTSTTATMHAPNHEEALLAPAFLRALREVAPITEDARYKDTSTKRAQLNARRAAAAAKLATLNTRLSALTTVSAKFADRLVQNPGADQADPASMELHAERASIEREIAALDQAIKSVDAQLDTEVIRDLCGETCRKLQPSFRACQRGIVNGLLGLYYAQRAQARVHELLNQKGFYNTSHLQTFCVTDFGLIGDSGSWIAQMLRDLRASEIISEDERIQIIHGEVMQIDVSA